jgi:hypothetical protein
MSTEWPETIPSPHLEHLGCRLTFAGAIGLKNDKARALQQDLRSRISHSMKLVKDETTDIQLQVICRNVNDALDPAKLLSQRSAQLLLHIVDDRRQLKHLDYLIALEIAQAVSGVRGVKAFRKVPWRKLRHRYALYSLVHARNLAGKAASR